MPLANTLVANASVSSRRLRSPALSAAHYASHAAAIVVVPWLAKWGVVVRGGVEGGGGSGLGGLGALLLEHVEQGRTPIHRLCAGAPRLVCGGGGSAYRRWLGARELGPVHLPTPVAWGRGWCVHVKGLVAAHPECFSPHLLNLASRCLPWAHAGYVPPAAIVEAHYA